MAGENILAIQVHQTSLTSSDMVIDCELTAQYQPPLSLNLTKSGGKPVMWWFGPNDLLEQSEDLSWTPVPAGLSPFQLPLNNPKHFFRLRR